MSALIHTRAHPTLLPSAQHHAAARIQVQHALGRRRRHGQVDWVLVNRLLLPILSCRGVDCFDCEAHLFCSAGLRGRQRLLQTSCRPAVCVALGVLQGAQPTNGAIHGEPWRHNGHRPFLVRPHYS